MTSTGSATAYAKYKVTYLDYVDHNSGEYTISFDARISDVESTMTAIGLKAYVGFSIASRISAGFSAGSGDKYTGAFDFKTKLTQQWQRFSITVDISKDLATGPNTALVAGSQLTVHFTTDAKSTKPVEIRLVKLSKGTKDTGWSPAAYDSELEALRTDPTNMLLD